MDIKPLPVIGKTVMNLTLQNKNDKQMQSIKECNKEKQQ